MADVAYALVRAASKLISMLGTGVMKSQRRHECRRGTPRRVRDKGIQHFD